MIHYFTLFMRRNILSCRLIADRTDKKYNDHRPTTAYLAAFRVTHQHQVTTAHV
jgi:hypothetical protein